jgi:hypothetical protein
MGRITMSANLSTAKIIPMIQPAIPSATPKAAIPATKSRKAAGSPTKQIREKMATNLRNFRMSGSG